MASYRLYFLNPQGAIARAKEFEAASDDEALAFADELAAGRDVELWNQARLVARRAPARRSA
ncbi:MAG: hypothetical protein KGO51_03585 [Alphaproteobacteria bacterium]|nr:hypothetical protein [Alphaproteobacteria bacterium]